MSPPFSQNKEEYLDMRKRIEHTGKCPRFNENVKIGVDYNLHERTSTYAKTGFFCKEANFGRCEYAGRCPVYDDAPDTIFK
jgi:hypothetical protein